MARRREAGVPFVSKAAVVHEIRARGQGRRQATAAPLPFTWCLFSALEMRPGPRATRQGGRPRVRAFANIRGENSPSSTLGVRLLRSLHEVGASWQFYGVGGGSQVLTRAQGVSVLATRKPLSVNRPPALNQLRLAERK